MTNHEIILNQLQATDKVVFENITFCVDCLQMNSPDDFEYEEGKICPNCNNKNLIAGCLVTNKE